MTNITKCSLCGMCKSNCPIYKVTLKERFSPRGKAYLLKHEEITDLFYYCTMCGACKHDCPAEVDLEIRKQRKELVKKGVETAANKKMIENVRKFGNPFGEPDDSEGGSGQKDLYCC